MTEIFFEISRSLENLRSSRGTPINYSKGVITYQMSTNLSNDFHYTLLINDGVHYAMVTIVTK